MNASALNFEAIVTAKARHNEACRFPPHTVLLHPTDIERLGWEEGDTIAGLELKADPEVQPDRGRLLCDRDRQPEGEEATEAAAEDRELVHA